MQKRISLADLVGKEDVFFFEGGTWQVLYVTRECFRNLLNLIYGRARQDKPNGAHRGWCHCGAPYAVVAEQGDLPKWCAVKGNIFNHVDVGSFWWNRTFYPGPHGCWPRDVLCIGDPFTGVGEEQTALCRGHLRSKGEHFAHGNSQPWRWLWVTGIFCSKSPVNWNLLKLCCKCIQLIRIAVGNYAISFFHGLGIKPWFCFRRKLYTRSVIPNHSEPHDIGDVVKLRWKDVKDVRQLGRF